MCHDSFENIKTYMMTKVLSFVILIFLIGCSSNVSDGSASNVTDDSISPTFQSYENIVNKYYKSVDDNISDTLFANDNESHGTKGVNIDTNETHYSENKAGSDNTVDNSIYGSSTPQYNSTFGDVDISNDDFGQGDTFEDSLQLQVWEFLNNQIWNILLLIGAFFLMIIAYYLFHSACKLEDNKKISDSLIDIMIIVLSLFPLLLIIAVDRYSWEDILSNIFYEITLKITIGIILIISVFIIIISLIKYLNIAIVSSKDNDIGKRKISYLGILISLIHFAGSCASIFFLYDKFK